MRSSDGAPDDAYRGSGRQGNRARATCRRPWPADAQSMRPRPRFPQLRFPTVNAIHLWPRGSRPTAYGSAALPIESARRQPRWRHHRRRRRRGADHFDAARDLRACRALGTDRSQPGQGRPKAGQRRPANGGSVAPRSSGWARRFAPSRRKASTRPGSLPSASCCSPASGAWKAWGLNGGMARRGRVGDPFPRYQKRCTNARDRACCHRSAARSADDEIALLLPGRLGRGPFCRRGTCAGSHL